MKAGGGVVEQGIAGPTEAGGRNFDPLDGLDVVPPSHSGRQFLNKAFKNCWRLGGLVSVIG
jgi:hypothetical protein